MVSVWCLRCWELSLWLPNQTTLVQLRQTLNQSCHPASLGWKILPRAIRLQPAPAASRPHFC
jgi:hypothetical protein